MAKSLKWGSAPQKKEKKKEINLKKTNKQKTEQQRNKKKSLNHTLSTLNNFVSVEEARRLTEKPIKGYILASDNIRHRILSWDENI